MVAIKKKYGEVEKCLHPFVETPEMEREFESLKMHDTIKLQCSLWKRFQGYVIDSSA
jgi:hypothetical protein